MDQLKVQEVYQKLKNRLVYEVNSLVDCMEVEFQRSLSALVTPETPTGATQIVPPQVLDALKAQLPNNVAPEELSPKAE